jgi:hypothetical protein
MFGIQELTGHARKETGTLKSSCELKCKKAIFYIEIRQPQQNG